MRVDSEASRTPTNLQEEYDDDEDTMAGDQQDETVEVSAEDLQSIMDLIGQLEDFVQNIIGGGDDDSAGPDAVDEEDMTRKEYDDFDYETKAGPLTNLVDELGEEVKGSVANFDDLADLAEQFDEEIESGDVDDAMDTASNFVDAMKFAIDETTEQDASDQLTNLAEEFAEFLQNAGVDTSQLAHNDDTDTSGEGEKSEPFKIDMNQLALFENMTN